jgi:hypothetical protein
MANKISSTFFIGFELYINIVLNFMFFLLLEVVLRVYGLKIILFGVVTGVY